MLLTRLVQAYQSAIKAKEENKKIILNYVLAQIKNKEIELQRVLVDEEIISILRKEVKALSESIGFLQKAGKKQDLTDEEEKKGILEQYLPQYLDRVQTESLLERLMVELGIQDLRKERWTLMKVLMVSYKEQLDPALVNEIINHKL